MPFDFDHCPDRRSTESFKWKLFKEDVLPMWVADMDFLAPPAVMEALHRRVDHGIFGYAMESEELKLVIVDRWTGCTTGKSALKTWFLPRALWLALTWLPRCSQGHPARF